MCPLYDFACDKCGTKIEKITTSDTVAITCDCGGMLRRQLSMPRIALDGTDPSFPGAYEKWANVREQRAKEAKKKSYYEG